MNSAKVLQQIAEYMDRQGVKSMLSSICNNQEFSHSLRISSFESWRDKGIHMIRGMLRIAS